MDHKGCNDKSEKTALKNLLQQQHPDLGMIQETKMPDIDYQIIKSIWSLNNIGWSFVEAYGKSGGLLIMWDESKVTPLEFPKGGYSLSVKIITHCKIFVG